MSPKGASLVMAAAVPWGIHWSGIPWMTTRRFVAIAGGTSSLTRKKPNLLNAYLATGRKPYQAFARRQMSRAFGGADWRRAFLKIRPMTRARKIPKTSINMVAPIISHMGGDAAARIITA